MKTLSSLVQTLEFHSSFAPVRTLAGDARSRPTAADFSACRQQYLPEYQQPNRLRNALPPVTARFEQLAR